MAFTVTDVRSFNSRRLLASTDTRLYVAEVDVDGAKVGFSRWADEPRDQWLCDSVIEANGYPRFIHGEGSRETRKQVAAPVVVQAILAYAPNIS